MNECTPDHTLLRWASQKPFLTALTGSILMLLCFPPVGWWPLAWIAAVPFVALIVTPEFKAAKPLRSIWFAGLIYWAIETYYIALPHPALYIAWAMLFSYLSIYPILFVWIGRKFVHNQNISVVIAAPIVFTALEWVRAHMLTGFGFSMLANSQYKHPIILQVCDIAGAYGLTFLLILFAAGLFQAIAGKRRTGLVVCIATLAFVVGYGFLQPDPAFQPNRESIDVAVVQGSIDTRFPTSETEARKYQEQLATAYLEQHLAWQRDNQCPRPDLIVWPEGKYPIPHYLPGKDPKFEQVRQEFRAFHEYLFRPMIEHYYIKAPDDAPPRFNLPAMIVGTTTLDPDSEDAYNSALLLGQQGQVTSAYHKMHLVPFGEFVPFVKQFPFLAKATPIGSGFQRGKKPVAFRIGEFTAAPNVCFESAVAHLLHESLDYLRSSGHEPDFMVNVTDDGWFYGHCLLDHHLACNVIRAVENRMPMIVASNTGFSAFIQSDGKILQQGPRRKEEILHMDFPLTARRSWYATIAYWPALMMTILCVLAIILPSRASKKPVDGKATE